MSIFFSFSILTNWSNVWGFLIIILLLSVKNVPPFDTSVRGVGAPVDSYYTLKYSKCNRINFEFSRFFHIFVII